MATYVWCELVCDHCSGAICGQWTSGQKIPRRELQEDARMKGAVFSGDDVFCCEDHHISAQPKSIIPD